VTVQRHVPRLAVVAAAGLAIAAVYRLRKQSAVHPVLIRVGFGAWGSGATVTARSVFFATTRESRGAVMLITAPHIILIAGALSTNNAERRC
jgi:hypothetical protein